MKPRIKFYSNGVPREDAGSRNIQEFYRYAWHQWYLSEISTNKAP